MNEANYIKAIPYKCYGSIPHLPGSRLGVGDHHCSPGQAKIATEKSRDKHDLIIVQEKLDGSNVGVIKLNNEITALTRSGYFAKDSTYPTHTSFAEWVNKNKSKFNHLLAEGERICGEWLGQAIGTRYDLKHEPFVAFDIMTDKERLPYFDFVNRASIHDFVTPFTISIGQPFSVECALECINTSGHGAIDKVEGAVWRVERKGKVDFLCKYVRHDKEDGKYFPEKNNGQIIWNCEL
jgi:hypothetical protein